MREYFEAFLQESIKKVVNLKNWTAKVKLLRKGMDATFISDVLDASPEFA